MAFLPRAFFLQEQNIFFIRVLISFSAQLAHDEISLLYNNFYAYTYTVNDEIFSGNRMKICLIKNLIHEQQHSAPRACRDKEF